MSCGSTASRCAAVALVLAVWIPFGGAVWASQDIPDHPTQSFEPNSKCCVFGEVLDANRKPIEGVLVTLVVSGTEAQMGELKPDDLSPSRAYSTKTDGEGQYMVGDIPDGGEAVVSFFKEGYAGGRKGARFDRQTGPVQVGVEPARQMVHLASE